MAVFDYVIVGAGSAGCVLAGRLSEDPDTSVCLLEAGGSDNGLAVKAPVAFNKLFLSERDWAYYSDPEPGLLGRRVFMPRGKMLGGSSSMNAQLFVRGNRADYDGWVKEGAHGWSYDEVLPTFRRMEDFARGENQYRGVGGPLHVNDHRSRVPVTEDILAAVTEAGLPFNDDYNAESQDGVSYLQVTQHNGRRFSAADAWLRPAMKRKNLTVLTQARALRLQIDSGRATGVVVSRDGGSPTVIEASREVVLAAGAIGSPHLLMLSGIGPADHLGSRGIEVVADNPHVGANLQDHPYFVVNFETSAKGTLADAEHPLQLAQFLLRGRGLLTSTFAEGTAFFSSRSDLPAPDLQLLFGAAYFHNHGLEKYPKPALAIAPTLVAPKSRGRILLRSSDPLAAPSIVGNHLTERADVEAMRFGVEFAREVARQPSLIDLVGTEITPGAHVSGPKDVEQELRRDSELIYHPTSTVRMGPPETGAVDPLLRVYGVERLRVVDASVFPTIPRGNPNAAVYLVAERAAELLR